MIHLPFAKAKHLYHRASFGMLPIQVKYSVRSFFQKKESTPIDVIVKPEVPNGINDKQKQLVNEVFLKSQENMMKLNLAWMEKLGSLDEGDLLYQVDFRSVYATLLGKWMGADPSKILREDFPALGFI